MARYIARRSHAKGVSGWLVGRKTARLGSYPSPALERFQASYEGPDLIRHTAPKTFSARIDAEHWLAAERRLIEREEWTSPRQRAAGKPFRGLDARADYGPEWIEQRTKNGEPLKPRTKSHYKALLSEHIEPTLGRIPLKDITPRASASGTARCFPTNPPIGLTPMGYCTRCCKPRSGTAISSNPAQIRGAAKSSRKRQPVILDVAEVGQLADAIEPRFRAFILISAWLGTRFGETTELRRRDVSKDFSVVTVYRGVVHRDGECVIGTTKSG